MSKTTQITIEGGIYLDTGRYANPESPYKFFSGPGRSWEEYVFVVLHTITFEMPASFDPRADQIRALEAQKRELAAKYQAAVTEISSRIAKLQAISFDEVAQ